MLGMVQRRKKEKEGERRRKQDKLEVGQVKRCRRKLAEAVKNEDTKYGESKKDDPGGVGGWRAVQGYLWPLSSRGVRRRKPGGVGGWRAALGNLYQLGSRESKKDEACRGRRMASDTKIPLAN
jgi:hypothetical protein